MIEKQPLKSSVGEDEICLRCGECLAACPYIKLNPQEAREQMNNLRDGKPNTILTHCVGCITCTAMCKHECNPYSLIRQRLYERYQREGIPVAARYLLPNARPNFRTAVKHPPEETAFIDSLATLPDHPGDVIYTGCNALAFPNLLRSGLFDGTPMFGSIDYCCGEMYHRMGLRDSAAQNGATLAATFAQVAPRRVIFLCAACMNVITNVMPREYDIPFPYEKIYYLDWIFERVDRGELSFSQPYGKTVTIHDTCHAKEVPEFFDQPRRFLAAAGAGITEMRHHCADALCCGVAAGCASYSPRDILSAGFRRLAESAATKADATVAICNGCSLVLTMFKMFYPWAPPVVPMLHIAVHATGFDPGPPAYNRPSAQMLAGVTKHAIPALASSKRIFAGEV